MSLQEVQHDVETTVCDLAEKVREAVLAGNAAAGAEWASALRDCCSGLRELAEIEED